MKYKNHHGSGKHVTEKVLDFMVVKIDGGRETWRAREGDKTRYNPKNIPPTK